MWRKNTHDLPEPQWSYSCIINMDLKVISSVLNYLIWLCTRVNWWKCVGITTILFNLTTWIQKKKKDKNAWKPTLHWLHHRHTIYLCQLHNDFLTQLWASLIPGTLVYISLSTAGKSCLDVAQSSPLYSSPLACILTGLQYKLTSHYTAQQTQASLHWTCLLKIAAVI